jgi:hypothetical protein
MERITLGGLREAIQSGAFRTVGVAAAGGLFFVTVLPRRGGGWVVLEVTRGKQARAFRDPGKAIALLHGLGARKILVDVSLWDPARAGEHGWQRPDVAARQRRAHGAAALVAKLGDEAAEEEPGA